MSKLQNRLEALQPYVIGIRYVQGIPVIDVVFKDGWVIPDSEVIRKEKGDDNLNYHMFFTEKEGLGLDELLDYIDTIIQLNVERENKHEFLKEKVKELQELFKKTSLVKLKKIKFVFDDTLSPDFTIDDITLGDGMENDISAQKALDYTNKMRHERIENGTINNEELTALANSGYTEHDDNEDDSIARAENYARIMENKANKNNVKRFNGADIELPPKNKIELETFSEPKNIVCKCGVDEFCPACIDEEDD